VQSAAGGDAHATAPGRSDSLIAVGFEFVTADPARFAGDDGVAVEAAAYLFVGGSDIDVREDFRQASWAEAKREGCLV
jgi:hypothetical protein